MLRQRKKGAGRMRKRKGTKIFCVLAVLMAVVISGMDVTQLYAEDESNELGLTGTVIYSEDKSSAELGIDMSKLDTDKYTITEITGPDGEQLDQKAPKVKVTANGEYEFIVNYQKKEDQKIAETSNSENDTSISGDIGDAQISGAIEQLTKVTETITIKYNVNKIAGAESEDYSTLNENALKNAIESSALKGSGSAKVEEVFDVDNSFVTGDPVNYSNPVPFTTATNINGSVNGNTIITYNPTAGGEVPHSEYSTAGGAWFSTTGIPSKEKISMRANWEFEGEVDFSSNVKTSHVAQVGLFLTFDGKPVIIYMVVRKSVDQNISEMGCYRETTGLSAVRLGGVDYLSVPRTFKIRNVYNSTNDTFELQLSCGGYAKSSGAIKVSDTGAKANMSIKSDVAWGAYNPSIAARNNYPVVKTQIKFNGFQYNNLNPLFEDLKWYDANGKEVTNKSEVNVGDVLTVKAKVKNDVSTADVINAKVFLSDDSTQASTKGVSPSDALKAGIPVELTNTSKEISFNVTVDDTIGDISLGLQLEDNVFHSKQYKQVSSRISIGKVFEEDSPSYTVMELARNADGTVITDASGKPTYVESKDQSLIDQDSYVRVNVSMTNPREKETLNTVLKLDTTDATGLDFDSASDLSGISGNVADLFKNGVAIDLDPAGTAEFSFIVPVKQSDTGAPFHTGEQKLNITVDGSFTKNGVTSSGTWESESVITDSITDIDLNLNVTNATLERNEAFDLSTLLTFTPVTSGTAVTVDPDSLSTLNQGTADDWKKFGLDAIDDKAGTVSLDAEDGTTMKTEVTYNGVLLVNGEKHYTRKGSGTSPAFRTKTAEVTLKVNGGVLNPSVFFEIPTNVKLYDSGGIDDDHAGANATVGLKKTSTTSLVFDVKADNNFLISNTTGESYTVALYDKDKKPYAMSTDGKADLGSFSNTDREKTVWYNILKDPYRNTASYKGTMMFYISSR